jgi:hypothetical protein
MDPPSLEYRLSAIRAALFAVEKSLYKVLLRDSVRLVPRFQEKREGSKRTRIKPSYSCPFASIRGWSFLDSLASIFAPRYAAETGAIRNSEAEPEPE